MATLESAALQAMVARTTQQAAQLPAHVKGHETEWCRTEEQKHAVYHQRDAMQLLLLLQEQNHAGALAPGKSMPGESGGFIVGNASLFHRAAAYCLERL